MAIERSSRRGTKSLTGRMRSHVVETRKTVRGKTPRLPFERIATSIWGERYELSLVICGDALARRMNSTYRHKNYAANVLSFPLGNREGELFLNVQTAARERKRYEGSLRARLLLLFIHGCLHLKGMRHGKRMDALEMNLCKRFG